MRRDYIKPILTGIGLALITVCVIFGLAVVNINRLIPIQLYPTAIITKIAVPIPTVFNNSNNGNSIEPRSIDSSEVQIGSFVQITGTGGVGLRIRHTPGTGNTAQFIAMENEVFEVKDGPLFVDDFTWWFLEATYDNNRQGWAASPYLTVIKYP